MSHEKELLLSGVIRVDYHDGFSHVYLDQPDGTSLDLVYRIDEVRAICAGKIQLSYFITEHPATMDEATEGFVRKLVGGANDESIYKQSDYSYSEYTTGTDYDTELNIGGHDLFKALIGTNGKYMNMRILYTRTTP